MTNDLSLEIKEQMRENARSLVEIMVLEEQPFRIVLWNNDNWNMPLPDTIMESFPSQLVLDIKEMALQESYIDENTGEIVLVTMFSNREYSKILNYDEIVGILDLSGQPYILNTFKQEEKESELQLSEMMNSFVPKTIDDLVELAVSNGIPEENAKRSINAFMQNNPKLKERFK